MGIKTVCLDLDGTVAEYDGWQGPHHIGPPKRGAIAAILTLQLAGLGVVICTARDDVAPVEAWVRAHGLAVRVTNEKPKAHIYIDDRGYHFDGDWDKAVAAARAACGAS